jgi:hypothetical protein
VVFSLRLDRSAVSVKASVAKRGGLTWPAATKGGNGMLPPGKSVLERVAALRRKLAGVGAPKASDIPTMDPWDNANWLRIKRRLIDQEIRAKREEPALREALDRERREEQAFRERHRMITAEDMEWFLESQ